MDAPRFDAITRSLDLSAPRRAAMSGALGMGLGTLLGFLHVDDGAAKKRKRKKKKCRGDTKKCGKKCIPQAACCGGCAEGQECCAGTCRDLLTDGANCGACGNACNTGGCLHGACTCNSGEDCPAGCKCALSAGGQTACAGPVSEAVCTSDDNCPVGNICRQTVGGNFCSEPCLS